MNVALLSSEDTLYHFIKSLLAVGVNLAHPWLRFGPQSLQCSLVVGLWPKPIDQPIHATPRFIVDVVRDQLLNVRVRVLEKMLGHLRIPVTQRPIGFGLTEKQAPGQSRDRLPDALRKVGGVSTVPLLHEAVQSLIKSLLRFSVEQRI